MVWYGMVWYGMVWYGMVWSGMVWYGTIIARHEGLLKRFTSNRPTILWASGWNVERLEQGGGIVISSTHITTEPLPQEVRAPTYRMK
jgi:hypothetical protein